MQLASRQNLYRRSSLVLMALMALEVTGPIHAQNLSPDAVRRYIAEQVGGIDKLTVPATDADIPVPAPVAGSGNTPYRYETTEAKRYLGKLLFHDPVRTVRINKNQNQPVDLPAGTAFGGELQRLRSKHPKDRKCNETDRSVRQLPYRRVGRQGRSADQLQRWRRGPRLHGRKGDILRSPPAPD